MRARYGLLAILVAMLPGMAFAQTAAVQSPAATQAAAADHDGTAKKATKPGTEARRRFGALKPQAERATKPAHAQHRSTRASRTSRPSVKPVKAKPMAHGIEHEQGAADATGPAGTVH